MHGRSYSALTIPPDHREVSTPPGRAWSRPTRGSRRGRVGHTDDPVSTSISTDGDSRAWRQSRGGPSYGSGGGLDQPPVVRRGGRSAASILGLADDDPRRHAAGADGLELSPFVTFLVGENGSGSRRSSRPWRPPSALSPEAGRPRATTHRATEVGSGELPAPAPAASARAGGGSSSGPRPCTAGTRSRSSGSIPAAADHALFHEMSHGESFLEVLRTRFDSPASTARRAREAARCRSRRRSG